VPQRLRRVLTRICGSPALEPLIRAAHMQSSGLFSSSTRQTSDVPPAPPQLLGSAASMGSMEAALQRIRAEVPGFKGFGGTGSFTAGMLGSSGAAVGSHEGAAAAVERSSKSAGAASAAAAAEAQMGRRAAATPGAASCFRAVIASCTCFRMSTLIQGVAPVGSQVLMRSVAAHQQMAPRRMYATYHAMHHLTSRAIR